MKLLVAAFCILLSCNIQDATAQLQSRLIGFESSRWDANSTVVIFSRWGERVCSGALIHPEWVLTSATCALRTFDEEMRVKVGGKVTLDFDTAEHIKNTYIHPEFCGWSLSNDIALIKLVSPTSKLVRTVKISNNNSSLTGERAFVLGYGQAGSWSRWTDGTLREYGLTILDNMLCWNYPVFINCNKLCTYESRACEGDQGGPLVSEDKKTLYGLISITPDQASMCGGDKIIPVTAYTRVSPYRDWILNTTKISYL